MSLGEFFTKTIMDSYLNQLLSIAALGAIGGCVEYCREKKKDYKHKMASAQYGGITSAGIDIIGMFVYSSYRDFNIYRVGITALCAGLTAYNGNNADAKTRKNDPSVSSSVSQSIVAGLGGGVVLGFMVCKIGEAVLSK